MASQPRLFASQENVFTFFFIMENMSVFLVCFLLSMNRETCTIYPSLLNIEKIGLTLYIALLQEYLHILHIHMRGFFTYFFTPFAHIQQPKCLRFEGIRVSCQETGYKKILLFCSCVLEKG